tara:strand:+ start:118 stop:2781 length:2664 start_codon:yes stop_codon:yes gene_type:complete
MGALGGRSTYTENQSASKAAIRDLSKGGILDKASILLTPTSYSDGKMRSVKSGSTVTHSENFATNTTGTPWQTSDSSLISYDSTNNLLKIVYETSSGNVFKRGSTLLDEAGTQYKVTFRARGTRATAFTAVGSNNVDGAIKNEALTYPLFQDYEFDVTTDTHPAILRLYLGTGSADDYLEITDILIQDTSSDFTFTRNSSATRVGPDGLIQDMQDVVGEAELVTNGNFSALGPELVPNGDFSDGLTGWTLSGTAQTATQELVDGKLSMYSGTSETSPVGNSNVMSRSPTLNYSGVDTKWYRLKLDVSGFNGTSSTGTIRLNGNNEASNQISFEAGENTVYFKAHDNFTYFRFTSSSYLDTYTVDNVSLKQVDPNDGWGMTNITDSQGWSFVDNAAYYDGGAYDDNDADSTADDAMRLASTTLSTINGATYKVTFEVLQNTGSGANTVFFGSGTALSATHLSLGYHTFYSVAAGTSYALSIYARPNEAFKVSNVSIKNITIADDLDIPRISYDKDGLNGHILLEPVRTNNVGTSEVPSLLQGISSSPVTSPRGDNAGFRITENTETTGHYARVKFPVSASTQYAFSVFAKKGSNDAVKLVTQSSGVVSAVVFNFSTKTFEAGSTSGALYEEYANGWFRISWSATSLNAASNSGSGPTNPCDLYVCVNDDLNSRTGDGSSYTDYYGMQVEEGSYPTSYIPTHTGVPVTRSSETMTNSGNSSLINSAAGTLYLETAGLVAPTDGLWRLISISDATNNNRLYLGYSSADNQIASNGDNASGTNVENVTVSGLSNIDSFKKMAAYYSSGTTGHGVFVEGAKTAGTVNAVAYPANIFTRFGFDSGSGSSPFYGKIKCAAYFNEVLTDDEIEALTGDSYNSFSELAAANGYTIQ